jgi:hypothetical protein
MNDEKEYVDSRKHAACMAVPQSIPRTMDVFGDKARDGDLAMKLEWFSAMKGGPAPYSNFDIAAYLTEIILLGCVALRVGVGHKLDWDGPNMRATNEPLAAQFVKRHNRRGWSA